LGALPNLLYDAAVTFVDKVAGLFALSLFVAGCSSAPAPTPSPSPPVYKATANLCGRVDHNALSAVLGPLKSSTGTPGTGGGGTVVARSCSFHFGTTTPIPVEVSIRVATDGSSVASYYQGLRGIEDKQTRLSTVSGLGQDAYTYEDVTGPHLVAYDNNLYLSYAVVMGALPQSSVPSGVVGAEVASAHATMGLLASIS
jgi:hypothetical protein